MGCAAYSWRTAEARDRSRSVDGGQVHGKRRRPGSGQTWQTFLRNHVAGIGAMDFLVVPTINFRLLFVLVILRHERQRLISLSVTDHPTAEWIARQIIEAFPGMVRSPISYATVTPPMATPLPSVWQRWASGIIRLRLDRRGRMAMRRG